jgi:hypothetical protein
VADVQALGAPRVWVIGENNPYQSNAEDEQRYAMYPEPPESAGGRLCNLILGMEQRAYLLGRSELTRGRAAAEREVAHVG